LAVVSSVWEGGKGEREREEGNGVRSEREEEE
jgi:hypothetical protein